MKTIAKEKGLRAKAGLAALGIAVLAVPLASALAQDNAPPPAGVAKLEAGPAAPASAPLTDEQMAHAREVFDNFSCGACHTLGDAGAAGAIGPSFDGDTSLDHAFIVGRVTNGQGAMPSFGGQIPDDDINLLASYILQVKK